MFLLAIYLFIHIVFEGIFTGPFYDKDDLVENLVQRKDEIYDAKKYFQSIVPEGAIVNIEFESNNKLAIFHVKAKRPYESN